MNYIHTIPVWYKGGCLLLLEKNTMATTKQVHLRLRSNVYDMLKQAVDNSAHRSMSAFIDEILEQELITRHVNSHSDRAAETMRSLVNRDG